MLSGNSVDADQTAPSVWSLSVLFAQIILSVQNLKADYLGRIMIQCLKKKSNYLSTLFKSLAKFDKCLTLIILKRWFKFIN